MDQDFSTGSDSGSSPDLGGSTVDNSTLGSTNTSGATTPGTPEQTVEIKWNGRTEKVPYSRALELAQKGYDYTQKMQALAKEREEFGSTRSRYDQAFSEVRTFLQNPQQIREYLQRMEGTADRAASQASQTGDPEDIVTARQLAERLEQAKQEFTGFTQTQLAQMRTQISTEQLAGQYTQDLNGQIMGLKKAMPELQAIPQLAKLLKEEVQKMGPSTIQEAKEMMIEVAKHHQRQIQKFMYQQRKGGDGNPQASTNPMRSGIEPAGGAPPISVQSAEKFPGGIKSSRFKDSIVAELTAMQNKG